MQLQNMQALLGPDATQIAGIKRERSGRASLDEKMQQYAEVLSSFMLCTRALPVAGAHEALACRS